MHPDIWNYFFQQALFRALQAFWVQLYRQFIEHISADVMVSLFPLWFSPKSQHRKEGDHSTYTCKDLPWIPFHLGCIAQSLHCPRWPSMTSTDSISSPPQLLVPVSVNSGFAANSAPSQTSHALPYFRRLDSAMQVCIIIFSTRYHSIKSLVSRSWHRFQFLNEFASDHFIYYCHLAIPCKFLNLHAPRLRSSLYF